MLTDNTGSGIIYTATVKEAERLHAMLRVRFSIGVYHGKMNPSDRKASQNAFMRGEVNAIVATNAFGLGIDKRDLRFVLHYHFPGSVEAYYQEAGRAGRDGEPAVCTILYRVEDSRAQSYFLGGKYPDVEEAARVALLIEQDRAKLRAMVGYCQSARCRTRFLLEYFGEPADEDWACGNCDACDAQQAFALRSRRMAIA